MKTTLLLTLTVLLSTFLAAQQKTDYRFSFSPVNILNYTKVDPSQKYSEELGYGFDYGTVPTAIYRGGRKPLTSGFVTSDYQYTILPGMIRLKHSTFHSVLIRR